MAFLNLRENNQVYILHKDVRKLELGIVTNTPTPTTKFQNSQMIYQPQVPIQVVDISVTVDGNNYNFQQLPALSEIVDYGNNGNVVISCTKQAMEGEVQSIRRRSEDRLSKREEDEKIIADCDTILAILNPEIEQRKKTEAENAELRKELRNLQAMMTNLMQTMNTEKSTKSK